MIHYVKALTGLIGAVTTIKNLKSKSTVAGVSAGATGAVVASQTLPPDSPEAIITNFVCAAIALYGLFKGARQ
ncbi:hypothetical protein [Zhongshania sp.]|uniref:hypothetical protein n=1 Tax=Zhongshania sp. TaxID=1971902 RepID=UPI00356A0BA0